MQVLLIGDSKTCGIWESQARYLRLFLMGLLELNWHVLHLKDNVRVLLIGGWYKGDPVTWSGRICAGVANEWLLQR
jgi:lysophospholipase L1-like esterase